MYMGGTSDPLFRLFNRLIKANDCIENDAPGDRKSRDALINQ